MTHISPKQSRKMAQIRLAAVLAADKAETDQKERSEQERTTLQVQRVIQFKASLERERSRMVEEREAALMKAKERDEHLKAYKQELEASGKNAEAVLLERRELRRQQRERNERMERELACKSLLEDRLRNEEKKRRELLRIGRDRHMQKEILRKKVSRSLIEIESERLKKRREVKQLKRIQAQEEEKTEANLSSTIDLCASSLNEHANTSSLSSRLNSDVHDDDYREAIYTPVHSLTLLHPLTHLQHYQRKAHLQRLSHLLKAARYEHDNRERIPIMGKLYSSPPFIASPAIIEFNDVQKGEQRSLHVTLTNTSFTFASIQFKCVSGQLADCIRVQHRPSGNLSSGQATQLSVIFTCSAERDGEASVDFVSEHGPVCVPIHIRSRRAIIQLDKRELSLDATLGDDARTRIRLANIGARNVQYVVHTVNESHVSSAPEDDHIVEDPLYHPITFADTGKLVGYSHFDLAFMFRPTVAASSQLTLRIECTPLLEEGESPDMFVWGSVRVFQVHVSGLCRAIPVNLVDPHLSFGTCIPGKLYRSSLTLKNHSTVAHRFTMHCLPALREFVSFLPVVGYVQPSHTLDVQVKFRVPVGMENDLLQKLKAHQIDGADIPANTFHVLMHIEVAAQTIKLDWTLKARLTPSRIKVSQTNLNFGNVFIGQTAVIPLELTNGSVLLQKLVFINMPSHCSVLTDDGLICIMPLRKAFVNVAFTPQNSTTLSWHLLLKTKLGEIIRIRCVGTGMKTLVEFDRPLIKMRAVAFGDAETAVLALTNTSSVQRIVRLNCPPAITDCGVENHPHLSIKPHVVALGPQESQAVRIIFEPTTVSQLFESQTGSKKSQIVQVISNEPAITASAKSLVSPSIAKNGKAKKLAVAEQARLVEEARLAEEKRTLEEQAAKRGLEETEAITLAEEMYNSLEARKQRNRENPVNVLLKTSFFTTNEGEIASNLLLGKSDEALITLSRHRIECLISLTPDELALNVPHRTYMQVHTCAVGSPIAFDKSTLDFGTVAVDDTVYLQATFTNTSCYTQMLSFVDLNSSSPFRLLSSLSRIEPQQTESITFLFHPLSEGSWSKHVKFVCTSRIRTLPVRLTLLGSSIFPKFTLSSHRLRLACITSDSTPSIAAAETKLQFHNESSLSIKLEITINMKQGSELNWDGFVPFACNSKKWIIEPKATADLLVRFDPDHISMRHFVANLIINKQVVNLRGVCNSYPVILTLDSTSPIVVQDDFNMNNINSYPFFDCLAPDISSVNASFASAFTSTGPVEKSKDVSIKSSKPAKAVAKSASSDAGGLDNISSTLQMPFCKLGLYDRVALADRVFHLVIDGSSDSTRTSKRIGVEFFSFPGAEKSANVAVATFELSFGCFDILDTFFTVSPSTSSLKVGKAREIMVTFDSQRFCEWREGQGGEEWALYGRKRPFVDSLIRVRTRYTNSEKNPQSIAETCYIVVRAATPL